MTVNCSTTFSKQHLLSKLPIPDLEETCRKYLDAVRPLQTYAEHQRTKAVTAEFLANEGPRLNEMLKEYSKDRSSYIEQFWYDSYLNYDNPVVLNLNPFFLLEDDPSPFASGSQVNRAASLVISSLNFIRALRREELPYDNVRGKPLCMYQYSRLFGTSRIPNQDCCIMQTDTTSRHIVVVARSQFYWFDVLDENSDIIISEAELSRNLETIVSDAQDIAITEAAKRAVGVLTTENRRDWANLRDVLTNGDDANNREILSIIDSALFMLCLDHVSPENLADLSRNILCGTSSVEKGIQVGSCTNRWYDKLQIIVTKNGSAGVNFEHTGVDGHTVLRFVSDIFTDSILRYAKSITGSSPSIWPSQGPDPVSLRNTKPFISIVPRRLEWTLVPELSIALRFAESRLSDLIHQTEVETLEFRAYGTDFIKNSGFSPDAYVQLAFQAAYYALYGRCESTYEPAMTKYFLHGRTEAIRTVTDECLAFVRKFCEDAPAIDKIESLRRACDRHSQLTKQCSQGLGQDRHLYALLCMWQREFLDDEKGSSEWEAGSAASASAPQLPGIFADQGWDKLSNTILSTSNCGNPSLRLFGFGPTSPDGFGIGYILTSNSISICASSKHRQTKRFLETLQNYLLEMRNILRQNSRAKAASISGMNSDLSDGRLGRKLKTTAVVKEDEEDEAGDVMGGYGYFDMGEMDALLKEFSKAPVNSTPYSVSTAKGVGLGPVTNGSHESEGSRPASGATTPRTGAAKYRAKNIGRKLKLIDY
ncbi:hypothetical protein CANCADRAFT_25219 [Tortispora caseinolytica NRRL Y-17796]|uniref:Choline/carnitine acyltransferase domain-containing protein n=1 Tax=Tortispora caseinolytica NRRL Y-17796 TaxID=767744 RepID=A0A1E4TGI8_9ASCO|nr:hypothetical protein CANCADRAFT_25219 [Tortispora caseinolytica NRRL Y-17796]